MDELYPDGQQLDLGGGFCIDGWKGLGSVQMWKRTCSRGAAEGAVLEMSMGIGVMVMRRHRHQQGRRGRAQIQQERGSARRHEAYGHISSKQQHDQQEAGQSIASLTIYEMFAHTPLTPLDRIMSPAIGDRQI
jgi:hypothetical protein